MPHLDSLARAAPLLIASVLSFVIVRVDAQSNAPAASIPLEAAIASLGTLGRGPSSEVRCPRTMEGLRCLVERLYQDQPTARREALALFDDHAIVAGVEAEWTMDGGFRGLVRLVPERPVGRFVRHLRWVRAAHEDIAHLLATVEARATRPVRYRHRGLVYAFFRSVGRTTPSAYASDWHVGYNVAGALHRNEASVRSTLVHEIFHLNDQVLGFSRRELAQVHGRIQIRCGVDRRCLAPYAPTSLTVRGGTYYAFQPDNGDAVAEYAADLASRWFEEQGAMLEDGRLPGVPWKCRTEENAEAYRRIADLVFGGVDLTPPCAP